MAPNLRGGAFAGGDPPSCNASPLVLFTDHRFTFPVCKSLFRSTSILLSQSFLDVFPKTNSDLTIQYGVSSLSVADLNYLHFQDWRISEVESGSAGVVPRADVPWHDSFRQHLISYLSNALVSQ